MSADWDEVKRLAADFQRAQLSSTALKLSERNCIEIVKKLIELKLIEVIFTTDGKDYLTPPRLLKEINDELIVHGGRINLVDLAQIIGVDYNHVEVKASEFLNTSDNTYMVLGQLITSDYLDSLAEEINEKLQQTGEISISEITKQYDLPGDFLEGAIHARLGSIIQGQADTSDSRTIFTDSYVAQHTARIRGALSALTRPVPLPSVISYFKFPEKLFYHVAEDLIKEKRLAGNITGGRSERSIFIPDIYAKSQGEWIDSFYKQNGYLEYDAVSRLGILDVKTYLKKKFKDDNLTYLSTCCVGKTILSQIEASIEEALNSDSWVDVMTVLPSVFTPEDCQGMITSVTKSIAKQGVTLHVYCDSLVVSDSFIKAAENSFQPLMDAKAAEDLQKNPNLFTTTQVAAPTAKETFSKGKQDRKDEKKKRPISGKPGGGTQGRETKIKNTKRKYLQKDIDNAEADDDVAQPSKHAGIDLEFMDVDSMVTHLQKLDSFHECPEDFIYELAVEMHRKLKKKYLEVVRSLSESSAALSSTTRRKQHADYVEKFTSLLGHIIMFEKATKLFSDDISSQLFKHLLKTLGADLTNSVLGYLAQENGLNFNEDEASLTTEARQKLISKLPESLRSALTKLNLSLNAKETLEDFHSAIEVALGSEVCDMVIKKPDKKKEKQLMQNHQHSLLKQLDEAEDAALCLHVAVLLFFQTHTRLMLHASGKFVPHVITYLQRQVPPDVYQLLYTYQEMVIKKLAPSDNIEEKQRNDSLLIEMMPKIKETAVLYKKTSISEAEN